MGKMTRCPKCSKEIEKSGHMFSTAQACPGCGARQERRGILWIALAVVALGVIGAAISDSKKKDTPRANEPVTQESKPSSPTKSPKPPKPDVATSTEVVEVTAGTLYKDYVTNEIGADAKYRDKILRVSGILDRIGKDLSDEPFVDFVVAGDAKKLRATFSSQTGLGELKRPQTITIRCRGGNWLHMPTLTECVFEKLLDE